MRVIALCCLAVVLSGCRHLVAHSTLREELVDTNVVQRFGSADGPELTWIFGDGSPPVLGREVTHTWEKTGHHSVQGFSDDFLAERIELDVVPRPVTRAVPSQASSVIFAPAVKADFPTLVDFLEKVGGPLGVQRLLEDPVLPSLTLELLSATNSGIDPLKGIGSFEVPGFRGQVVLLGVSDGEKVRRALIQRLVERGGDDAEPEVQGLKVVTRPNGAVAMLIDRGYLYLLVPEPHDDVARVVSMIRESPSQGLESNAAIKHSLLELKRGQLMWVGYEAATDKRVPLVQSVVLALHLEGNAATLVGDVTTSRPIAATKVAAPMLSKAPEGPVAALALSLAPGEFTRMLVGAPGEARRQKMSERFSLGGLDLDALVATLTGEATALAWLDAETVLKQLVLTNGRPQPAGAIWVEAGAEKAEDLSRAAEKLFDSADRLPGATPRWKVGKAPLAGTLELNPQGLSVRLGTGVEKRPLVDWRDALVKRFEGSFGPGHTSLLLDVAQLKKELQTPRQISGVDPIKLVAVQGLTSVFLAQVAVRTVVLDLLPKGNTARLWGRIELEARSDKEN